MTLLLLVLHGLLAASAIFVSVLGVQARAAGRARLFATVLVALVGTQTLIGDVIYPLYVRNAKPALRALSTGSRSVADVFEVKEHLAFFALVFSIGAFLVARTEPKTSRLLRVLFGCAHGTIVLVAVLGLVVASLRTP